jgi:hypothetical protein
MGDLGLVEMLRQCEELQRKDKFPVAFRSVKYEFFLVYISSYNGSNKSLRIYIL